MKEEKGKLLEVGCGSGLISIEYVLSGRGSADCCDIDPLALKNAAWNALGASVDVGVFYSDVFEEVSKKYDIIAFNPPYLDNITGDGATEDNGSMERFIEQVEQHLKEGGRAYILISTENIGYGNIVKKLESRGWTRIKTKELFFERLEVWKLCAQNL